MPDGCGADGRRGGAGDLCHRRRQRLVREPIAATADVAVRAGDHDRLAQSATAAYRTFVVEVAHPVEVGVGAGSAPAAVAVATGSAASWQRPT